jgi:hypothetical protein
MWKVSILFLFCVPTSGDFTSGNPGSGGAPAAESFCGKSFENPPPFSLGYVNKTGFFVVSFESY